MRNVKFKSNCTVKKTFITAKVAAALVLVQLLLIAENSFAARYCVHNSNRILGCYDSLKICKEFENVNFRQNDECRPEQEKTNYPPSLKAKSSGAFCLWASQKSGFKNMGCMAQTVCEYSMRQYPQTVCAKGSITDMGTIKKLYVENEKNVKSAELASKNKAEKEENQILEKGNADEVAKLIGDKYGRLEYASPTSVTQAQNKLEPFCKSGSAKACYVLYQIYDLSDFKAQWNRTAQAQCEDLKKSQEYLHQSCSLGLSQACKEMPRQDDEAENENIFIREPHQNNVANDEAKGITCKKPTPSKAVYEMIEKCNDLRLTGEDANCSYSKKSDTSIEKMSYQQLFDEGENASEHKKTTEAIEYYKKACELKRGTSACLRWAMSVYEIDVEKGRTIYSDVCFKENAAKDFQLDCENSSQYFMPGQ